MVKRGTPILLLQDGRRCQQVHSPVLLACLAYLGSPCTSTGLLSHLERIVMSSALLSSGSCRFSLSAKAVTESSLWSVVGGSAEPGVPLAGPVRRPDGRRQPPGLSLVHPVTQIEAPEGGALLKIAENGHCVHVHTPRPGRPRIGAKRGIVKGLSRGAAARFKRLLLGLDQSKIEATWEGCLTVPAGEFTFAEFRLFLKRWTMRVKRRWPGVPVPWVKELTLKGELHLHFVVVWLKGMKVPTLTEFRAWNDPAWAEVVKSSHPSHWNTACRVERIRTWNRLIRYVSGYLTEGSEGRDRQSDTGKMWGVINRASLPRSVLVIPLVKAEKRAVDRTLCRLRARRVTYLLSKATHSLSRRWGKPVDGWLRLSGHPACDMVFKGPGAADLLGFAADRVRSYLKSDGWRLRVIRPRPFRREVVQNLWVGEVGSCRVERSPFASPVMVTRLNKLTGQPERVMVDEVNHVPNAWHYLPSSEVVRLIAFLRRDRFKGLTACERRWLESSNE